MEIPWALRCTCPFKNLRVQLYQVSIFNTFIKIHGHLFLVKESLNSKNKIRPGIFLLCDSFLGVFYATYRINTMFVLLLYIFVSIDFSPVVEIGVKNGHILPQETTFRILPLGYTNNFSHFTPLKRITELKLEILLWKMQLAPSSRVASL